MATSLPNPKLLLLDTIVIILLVVLVLAHFVLPNRKYDKQIKSERGVLNSLNYSKIEVPTGFIKVDKYKMPEPISSEPLIIDPTKTSKAATNEILK